MKKVFKSCLLIVVGFIGLIVVSIGGMFVAKICPPTGPWPQPPWCEGGPEVPPLPDIPLLGLEDDFDYYQPGEAGQVLDEALFLTNPISVTFFNPDQIIDSDGNIWVPMVEGFGIDYAVKVIHSRGQHVFGASLSLAHLPARKADPKPELAALDINGDPLPLLKLGMEGFLPGELSYSIFNPDWQELLIEQGKVFIDQGAEGISLDEGGAYGWRVYNGGGSFDEYSLAAFREHLAGKYTPEQLNELFGITEVDSFDFREYLLERGMEDSWNTTDISPPLITYEFYLCQNQGADAFLRRFVEELRTYAAEEYNRDFLFAFNSGPQYEFSRFMPVDYLDYIIGEMFYFANGHYRAALNDKLAQGVHEGPVVLIAEASHDTGELPGHTVNLFKYMFSDIFSSANTGMVIDTDGIFTMRGRDYVEPFVTFDFEEAERYYHFLDDNRQLFRLNEPARIGVLHSSPSLISSMLPVEEEHYGAYEIPSLIDLLLTERIPFGMLVSGDGLWARNELSLTELEAYEIVMLPNAQLISDEEVAALLEYAKGGGVVIQINGFGIYYKDGTPAERPELNDLTTPGVYPVGQGVWHTLDLWEEFGTYSWNVEEARQVQPAEHTPDQPAAVAIRETLSEYHSFEIQTDAPLSVTVRRYQDGERWVLHLVNYDYDQTTDQYTPSGPFQITVDVGESQISMAKIYDFERSEIEELTFEQVGNQVTMDIPSLEVYSILELLP